MTAGATGGIATPDCTCHMTFISTASGVTDMTTATAHRIVYTAKTGARCVDRVIGAPDRDSAVDFIQREFNGEVRMVTRNGRTEQWVDVIDADAPREWGETDNPYSAPVVRG